MVWWEVERYGTIWNDMAGSFAAETAMAIQEDI